MGQISESSVWIILFCGNSINSQYFQHNALLYLNSAKNRCHESSWKLKTYLRISCCALNILDDAHECGWALKRIKVKVHECPGGCVFGCSNWNFVSLLISLDRPVLVIRKFPRPSFRSQDICVSPEIHCPYITWAGIRQTAFIPRRPVLLLAPAKWGKMAKRVIT